MTIRVRMVPHIEEIKGNVSGIARVVKAIRSFE